MFNSDKIKQLKDDIKWEEEMRTLQISNLKASEAVNSRRLQALLDYLGLKWEHIEEKDIIVKKEEKKG